MSYGLMRGRESKVERGEGVLYVKHICKQSGKFQGYLGEGRHDEYRNGFLFRK